MMKIWVSIIIILIFLGSKSVLVGQTNNIQLDSLNNIVHQAELEYGVTVGYIFFFGNLEFSVATRKRFSKYVILEAKSVNSLLVESYSFNNYNRTYNLIIGGTGGINLGKKNKFFELTLGAAYFYWPNRNNSFTKYPFLPIGSIGFKQKIESTAVRIGVGFPNGIYFGCNF